MTHRNAEQCGAGATKGDEGYAERKNMTEARVEKGLQDGSIVCAKGKGWFKEQIKRSDLADCLSMVQDHFAAGKRET